MLDNCCNANIHRPFRFWCQKVLPAVYDDSLSYYELLCKLYKLINQDRDAINHIFDGLIEIDELLDKWLSGGFSPDIEAAVDDWFDEHGDVLEQYINQFFTDNPEFINDKIDDWADDNENIENLKIKLNDEPFGYSSLWTDYWTSAHTIEIYEEIAPWFADNSYIRVSINPSINLMIMNLRMYTQLAEDTDEESPTYGQMIDLNQRLQQLGYDNNTAHWIPLFKLPEQRSTDKLLSLDFPIEIRRAQTDGKYYQTHAATNSRFYPNGCFAIYTYPQNFWRTVEGEGYSTQLWADCCRVYNVGYEYSRYNLRTADANRTLFVNTIKNNVGHWLYRQTAYNDTREDTKYIDCSGLIWWALWYGCNLPLTSYGGDAQEHMGEYVTSAEMGEPLDISVMKPGDIISFGYVPYTATEGIGYGQTTFTFTEQFSRSTHMAVYLGNNQFAHITDGWKSYGFTWQQGIDFDNNPSNIQESLIYPGVYLVSHGYSRENDNGVWRAKGPFVFEGMDVFRKDANTVVIDGETVNAKANYRTVVRYFSDTKSWMVD